MATGLTTQAKENVAKAFAAEGTWISLHTADPLLTGANEASGGGYARSQTIWDITTSAVDGSIIGSEANITVPVGTYTHVGVWSDQTGGTFVAGASIAATTVSGATSVIVVTPTFTIS